VETVEKLISALLLLIICCV